MRHTCVSPIESESSAPMSSSGHDDDSPERSSRNYLDGGVQATASSSTATNPARRVKKKRVRNFTEDDRAAHRIFEKSRREAFKEALTNLASLLPALADTEPQRLSKHVVVDESITFIRSQQDQINAVTEQLGAMKTERDSLLTELNRWRGGAGVEPRQASSVIQPTICHGDTAGGPEAILQVVPAALQHPAQSSIPIIGEAAPPFIPNTLHEPNPTPLSADPATGMHWESFEPQLHPFANHVPGENGANTIRVAEPAQLGAYPTPQSPSMPQFDMNRGQHGAVFLPFDAPQPFSPGTFHQVDTFMQNTVPLQDYVPP